MRRIIVIIFSVLAAGACTSSGPDGPSRARCEQALQHEVDLRIPAAMPAELQDAHRRTITASLASNYVDECAARWSSDRLDCITSAETAAAARVCSSPQE